MFSFLIILIYIYCIYAGYRRGLVYEGMMGIGFLISMLLAALLYKPFSNFLSLWVPYPSASDHSKFAYFDQTTGLTLDKSFYAAVAFVIILLIVFAIWQIVMHGFTQLQFIEINREIDIWGSILVALIMTQIGLFLFLFILATIPSEGLQNALGKSLLANSVLHFTPGISHLFINLFVTSI